MESSRSQYRYSREIETRFYVRTTRQCASPGEPQASHYVVWREILKLGHQELSVTYYCRPRTEYDALEEEEVRDITMEVSVNYQWFHIREKFGRKESFLVNLPYDLIRQALILVDYGDLNRASISSTSWVGILSQTQAGTPLRLQAVIGLMSGNTSTTAISVTDFGIVPVPSNVCLVVQVKLSH